MKKMFISAILLLIGCDYIAIAQGFATPALQWNIPSMSQSEYEINEYYHAVVDFNGDGKPDLIDGNDASTHNVFINGSQKYWKVYLNTSAGFSSTALQWNIPSLSQSESKIYDSYHNVLDFNGDGKPDLIDGRDAVNSSVFMNGTQKYWKVYLNTGAGFSSTAIQWNIPSLSQSEYQIYDYYHTVLDFNGDGKPDLIDGRDALNSSVFINGTQKYWKVYLNTGAGFSSTAIQWNIPSMSQSESQISESYHAVVDFNGDGKPDLIDGNDATTYQAFINGSQKYWKVYLNTGSGFSSTAVQWNIPSMSQSESKIYEYYHAVLDFNGDGKPDLIDGNDATTYHAFINGSQKYWKVYLNTGSGFSGIATQWNIPSLSQSESQIYDYYHSVLDFNGDGKPDLVDGRDTSISNVFINGTQKYWKVYLNNASNLGDSIFENQKSKVAVYPNPLGDILNISCEKEITALVIYNVLGQEVTAKSINADSSALDVSNLAAGTYFVRVTSDNLVETLKVIKE